MRPEAPAARLLVERLGARLDSVLATWSEVTESDVVAEITMVLTKNGVTDWIAAGQVPIAWLPPGGLSPDQFLAMAMKPGEVRLGCVEVAPLAVAETGSLLTHGIREKRMLAMLCDLHVLIVHSSNVVPDLDAAAAAIQVMEPTAPYISFVTGASRTSDIERTLTIGVHGPSRLHVVVVGG